MSDQIETIDQTVLRATPKVSQPQYPDKNYINFTNTTPNDQGSYIPNEVIDFTRYNLNPVILRDHVWSDVAIGMMRDIHFDGTNWKGFPDFHGLNEESKLAKAMYEKGYLVSSSIGGEMVLRTTGQTEWTTDENGNRKEVPVLFKDERGLYEAAKFTVFEISLPTLPSNYMAVTDQALKDGISAATQKLGTKIYEQGETDTVFQSLTTLSINLLNKNPMAEKNEKTETAEVKTAEAAEKLQEQTASQNTDNSNHVVLGTTKKSSLPKWLDNLIGMTAKYEAAHPEGEYGDTPIKEEPKKELIPQQKPTGMSAEAAKKRAERSVKEAEEAKSKFEEEEDEEKKEKFKKAYEEACHEAEAACKEAEDMEEKADEEAKAKKEAEESAKKRAEETTKKEEKFNAKPIKETQERLARLGLASIPNQRMIITENVPSFTKLQAQARKGEGEGARVLGRLFNGSTEGKYLEDYKMVLNSILADDRYRAIIEKTRFHVSPTDAGYEATRHSLSMAKPEQAARVGINFAEIAARLNAGRIAGMNFSTGQTENRTTLSTSGSFASLDTIAVEWLPLIIYKLFPNEEWMNEVPIFGVQQTTKNYGIIWTNITADPDVYRGTQPSGQLDYTYDDTAVGVSLTPYFLRQMRWTPYHMAQLRYDQQGSGWAQGLMKIKSYYSDDILYTLGAGALANGQPIIKTGGPIDNTQPQNFNIGTGSNGVDTFYFNPSYQGTLLKPGYNDAIKLEQNFKQLNFDLNAEKPVLVIDPIMDSYISQDKQTQSLLTRWVNESGADIQKLKHTLLYERSRVLAYDPIGGTIIDTNGTAGVVPPTTQSAGLSFIASQVGVALGQIDVFFVQDPANYGYKMSMDMRIGSRALRSDYKGVQIYAYGNGAQAGS